MTTQFASGNILLKANYNDSLTQSEANQAAADTPQWTHFLEPLNKGLTQMVLRPRSTTDVSVTKATLKHHHTSQKKIRNLPYL